MPGIVDEWVSAIGAPGRTRSIEQDAINYRAGAIGAPGRTPQE